MTERAGGMGRLLAELRRRNVFRVTGAYVIGVWVVLQVADVIFPPLLIPQWVITVLVLLAVIGLPVVVVLAWIFDITPTGVIRTQSADGHPAGDFHWNTRWIDYVIIAVLLAILAFVLTQARSDESPTPGRSIAVMPFSDLSFDGKHGYFCDGMSEALIDSLGRLRELRVTSRTSSFAYRDSPMDAREMATRLNVDTILEGSVRKLGNDVRIDARLVDGQNGYNLWSQSYEGTLDDIFLLQDKIARSIADVLEIKLLGSGELVETATRDHDAYDLFLRGRARLRQRGTLEDLAGAVEYFEQSLQRDPEFALAMAGLCTANWWEYEITRDRGQFERAISVCESAAEHKANADTHVALARLYEGTGQLDKARWQPPSRTSAGQLNSTRATGGIILISVSSIPSWAGLIRPANGFPARSRWRPAVRFRTISSAWSWPMAENTSRPPRLSPSPLSAVRPRAPTPTLLRIISIQGCWKCPRKCIARRWS